MGWIELKQQTLLWCCGLPTCLQRIQSHGIIDSLSQLALFNFILCRHVNFPYVAKDGDQLLFGYQKFAAVYFHFVGLVAGNLLAFNFLSLYIHILVWFKKLGKRGQVGIACLGERYFNFIALFSRLGVGLGWLEVEEAEEALLSFGIILIWSIQFLRRNFIATFDKSYQPFEYLHDDFPLIKEGFVMPLSFSQNPISIFNRKLITNAPYQFLKFLG